MSSPVTLEIDQGLAVLTFNNPTRGNVLDMAMASAFAAAVEQIAEDSSVRTLLITAQGKQFCVGGDVHSMADATRPLTDTLRALLEPVHGAMNLLSMFTFPVVCAINGAVGGGGIGLALCGDLVLAAESVKLRGCYSALGLTPDVGGSWFVTRRAGTSRAMEIFMTNRPIASHECLQLGLFDAVHSDADLPAIAKKLARQLADGPVQAQARIKSLINHAHHHSHAQHLVAERDAMYASGESDDGKEGVRAFIEKRAPKFH